MTEPGANQEASRSEPGILAVASDLRDSLVYKLNRAVTEARIRVESLLPFDDVEWPHLGLLLTLAEGPVGQRELGTLLWIDRTTMVKRVRELEGAGLLERAVDPSKSRGFLLSLTARGHETCCAIRRALAIVDAELLRDLPAEQQAALHKALEPFARHPQDEMRLPY